MKDKIIKSGTGAPDFTLDSQEGVKVTLSKYKGRKVLLSFHPLAWTPVCDIQMKALEAKYDDLAALKTVAFGISVDSSPSKKEWADYLDIEETMLLSDFWPHGGVADKYGVFIPEMGISGRANILIDENGVVEKVWLYQIPEIPDIEEIIRYIKK